MEGEEVSVYAQTPKPFSHKKAILIALVAGAILFLIYFFSSAPSDFPKEEIFSVKEGSTLRKVSFDLKENNIIRSRAVFEALVIMMGGDRRIISADYFFEDSLGVIEVARRISKGDRHLAPVKLTIPEGFTNEEIASIAAINLPSFNKEEFLRIAKPMQGYLFPDTYFFFTNATETEVLESLSGNFNKKILELEADIAKSKKSRADIVTMASIIEKESKGDMDRDMISGILWKRISIGMALQADAAPVTYKELGLPSSPIANPGISSIKAAINPKSSPYLYYIHDKNGMVHYAKNFSEHRQNIEKYLK